MTPISLRRCILNRNGLSVLCLTSIFRKHTRLWMLESWKLKCCYTAFSYGEIGLCCFDILTFSCILSLFSLSRISFFFRPKPADISDVPFYQTKSTDIYDIPYLNFVWTYLRFIYNLFECGLTFLRCLIYPDFRKIFI